MGLESIEGVPTWHSTSPVPSSMTESCPFRSARPSGPRSLRTLGVKRSIRCDLPVWMRICVVDHQTNSMRYDVGDGIERFDTALRGTWSIHHERSSHCAANPSGQPTEWIDQPHCLSKARRFSVDHRSRSFWCQISGSEPSTPSRHDHSVKSSRQPLDRTPDRLDTIFCDPAFDDVESEFLEVRFEYRAGSILPGAVDHAVGDSQNLCLRLDYLVVAHRWQHYLWPPVREEDRTDRVDRSGTFMVTVATIVGVDDDQVLRECRDSIDNIDAALVHMLAERFKITKRVGQHKATTGLAPADPDREAVQIARLRTLADSAGLDPAFTEKFLRFIVDEVIRHHNNAAS